MVYSGPRTNYIASDLTPVTRYGFHLQASTEGDDSPQSKVVSIITLESGKSEMSSIFQLFEPLVTFMILF